MVVGCGLWGSNGSALMVAGSVLLSWWQLCRLDRKGKSVCMSWWRLCRLDRKGIWLGLRFSLFRFLFGFSPNYVRI